MTGLGQFRTWVVIAFALSTVIYLWWIFARRPARRDPKLAIIAQLQSYRSLPLLQDRTIASRLAEIITAPLSRERLEQTLSISLMNPTGEDFAKRIWRIRIDTESEFDLVNIGSATAHVAVGEVSPSLGLLAVASISLRPFRLMESRQIGGKPQRESRNRNCPWSKAQGQVPSGLLRDIALYRCFSANHAGPQWGEVYRINARSKKHWPNSSRGLRQKAEYRHEWWKQDGKVDELTFRVPVSDPLLPGDAVILTIGA